MTNLERGVVYTGSGVITYKKEEIGKASAVNFTIVGLGFKQKEEGSIYGTIDGKIDKMDIIPELNSPHPTPLDIDAKLEDGTQLKLEGLLVIDKILKSGELKETEFHGPSPVKD